MPFFYSLLDGTTSQNPPKNPIGVSNFKTKSNHLQLLAIHKRICQLSKPKTRGPKSSIGISLPQDIHFLKQPNAYTIDFNLLTLHLGFPAFSTYVRFCSILLTNNTLICCSWLDHNMVTWGTGFSSWELI